MRRTAILGTAGRSDNDDKKKCVPMGISIIIVVGALILLVSPLIMGIFL